MLIRKRLVGTTCPEEMDADPVIEIMLSSDGGLIIHTWWEKNSGQRFYSEDIPDPPLPNIAELSALLNEVREYAIDNYPKQYKEHINTPY